MFSDATVVERVKKEFVPVALKAGLVNAPPRGEEGRLYAEIARSKPAPQGICAVNADGRVLAWSMMFEGKDALQEFLDHVLELNTKHPAGCEAFAAERYMKFPGDRLEDAAAKETAAPPKAHKDGERCPAAPGVEAGTLVGTLFGRTFKDGKPTGDTTHQERYLESRIEIAPEAQRALADAAKDAGEEEFDIPAGAAAALCGQAFLGQLDVDPARSESAVTSWKLRGRVEEIDGERWVRIEGSTSAKGGDSQADSGVDGRLWSNEVKLTWKGLAKLEGRAVTRLILTAEGREKLTWNHGEDDPDTSTTLEHLPAGRRIHLNSEVKFGLVAETAPSTEVGPRVGPTVPPKSLVEKMKKLQAAMADEEVTDKKRHKAANLMEDFDSFMKNREFEKAEALLDKALEAMQ